MDKFTLNVSGMTCAGCVANVEKAIRGVNGVQEAWVNFADHTAVVEGDVKHEAVIIAIADAGYGASESIGIPEDESAGNAEDQLLFYKTVYAGVIGLLLFVFSMTGLSPPIRTDQPNTLWLVFGVLAFSVLAYSGSHIFKGAWKQAKHGSANMDTLVALGTGAAWIYSMIVTIFPGWVPELARHVYFEASAVIIAFINFGSLLEHRARGKTSQAIKRLIGLQARTAHRAGGGDIVAGGTDQAVEYIRERAAAKQQVEYTEEQVRAVLAGEAGYLQSIGAVGEVVT